MWGAGLSESERKKRENAKKVKELELLADAGVLNPDDVQEGPLRERIIAANAAKNGNAQPGDKRDREGDWVNNDSEEFHTPRGDPESDQSPNLPPWSWESPWSSNLIPESASDPTRGMEVDSGPGGTPEPTAALARAGGGPGGNNPVSKETPISSYPTLTYGLQETHTTILPWTGWITAGRVDKNTPVQLKIRMTTPYDMLDATTQITPADQENYTKGLTSKMAGADGKAARSTVQYPKNFSSNATEALERPAWRDYWASFYEYFTVISCEYKIICVNPTHSFDSYGVAATTAGTTDYATAVAVQFPTVQTAHAVCGVQFDTYSSTATAVGNIMPLTEYEEVLQYKNIRWYRIPHHNGTTIIQGTYKPGQTRRNIQNDGDVKTWIKVSDKFPTLTEMLTLNFWQDPMNNCDSPVSVNMEIQLKYIVQFKDLKQQARYPNTITTDQDIVVTLNETPTANGTAHQYWA